MKFLLRRKVCFYNNFAYKESFNTSIVMRKSRIYALSFSLLLIWVDQCTKYIFYNLWIWDKLFFLYPLLNDWISWGMSMPMMVVIPISVLCIWLFVYLFYKRYLTILDFALLFAWTIWNLIDRIRLGWVRDFMSFWSFPVFNIADTFLTCGVAWIFIKEIFHLQNKEKNLP